MSPRPKRLTWLQRVQIVTQRSFEVPSFVLALAIITAIALVATAIGWFVYRA